MYVPTLARANDSTRKSQRKNDSKHNKTLASKPRINSDTQISNSHETLNARMYASPNAWMQLGAGESQRMNILMPVQTPESARARVRARCISHALSLSRRASWQSRLESSFVSVFPECGWSADARKPKRIRSFPFWHDETV